MAKSRHYGEHIYLENVQFLDVDLPAASIANAEIATNAAIAASKLGHQNKVTWAQPNSAATTETRIVYECHGATGTVKAFTAGSIGVAVGDSTVTLDLKKNNSSVLTGVVTLDSGNVARTSEAGTLSGTPTLADGDVLEIVITATIGTGTLPTGVWVALTLDEDPA